MQPAPFGLVALLVLLPAAFAAAGPPPTAGDPLHSAECRAALLALQVEESAVGPASRLASSAASAPAASAADGTRGDAPTRPLNPRLAAARRQAAAACLAGRADPPALPQRFAQPAATVTPVTGPGSPMPEATRPGTALPSPALPAPALTTVLSCDTGGCWANDGSRLNRVGPTLWGPRGACTVQGTLLQCP